MRTTLLIKVSLLVVLGVVTSLVTNTILAQDRKPSKRLRPVAQSENAGLTAHSMTTTTVQEVPLEKARQLPAQVNLADDPSVLASLHRERFNVNVRGRDVFVSAMVRMHDKRPDRMYFWSLRVTDPKDWDDVIREYDYTDQIFSMPAEQRLDPTFDELFQLAPGNYRVELSLYETRRGRDIKTDDADWVASHRRFKSSKRITIVN